VGGESLRGIRADAQLREKLQRLAKWHPLITRGGLSWQQLRDLVQRIAHRRGLRAAVELTEWPVRGSVQRIGGWLVIHVDSCQPLPAEDLHWVPNVPAAVEATRRRVYQVAALAHEIGHVALGHYVLEEVGVWYHMDGAGDDEMEWEADAFASLVTRSPGIPADCFIGEQIRLL
jgi:hypothetical protein